MLNGVNCLMMNDKLDVKKTLGILMSNVRERRRALGLSQDQLAERANLSVNYVSKIEIGLKAPSLSATIRLAVALEMEPSDILVEEAPKWMDEAQEVGFALRSVLPTEAEFLMTQFRSTLKLIRRLLRDNRMERE